MQETELIAFLKKAKTRGGVVWKVETLEKDSAGRIVMMKGYVNEMESFEEVRMAMYWNPTGIAVSSTPLRYDLIEELGISYGNQEGDATHEPPPQGPNQQG